MTLRWFTFDPPSGIGPPAATTPDGTVIYAVGDIHGRDDLLAEIHRGIAHDARQRPAQRRVLIYLGDYTSRGVDSYRVLERVIDWRPDDFEIVTLLGNHEALLLRFLDGDLHAGRHWLAFGGVETLSAYGIDVAAAASDEAAASGEDVAALAAQLRLALPDAHARLLRSLTLQHREGGYFFVHAGILPGVALEAQRDRDLVWIRDRFLSSACDHGAVIVHGHCISSEPEVRHNRIGIDTGAYRTGALTCLILDGAERHFLQTGGHLTQPPSRLGAALVSSEPDPAGVATRERDQRAERCALLRASTSTSTGRSAPPDVLTPPETS